MGVIFGPKAKSGFLSIDVVNMKPIRSDLSCQFVPYVSSPSPLPLSCSQVALQLYMGLGEAFEAFRPRVECFIIQETSAVAG